MKALINNIWWKVLIVHTGLLFLLWGGLNCLGVGVLLSVISSLLAWNLGSRRLFQKLTKTTKNSFVVFRG
jgi:hypothetical protein